MLTALTRYFGWLLVLAGAVLVIVGLVEFFDPIGTQMADDGNPFGQPPAGYESGFLVALGVTHCVLGRLITLSANRILAVVGALWFLILWLIWEVWSVLRPSKIFIE